MASASNERQTLQDFLKNQKAAHLLATVEALEGERVTITPWQEGVGCLCNASLEVPQSIVVGITPTAQKHLCCGKSLQVVEVEFEKSVAAHYDAIFSQLLARAVGQQTHAHDRAGMSGMPTEGFHPDMPKCPGCVTLCRRFPGSRICAECWAACDRTSGAGDVHPEMAKCPWCVEECRRSPGSRACTACWEACYGY